MTLLKVRKAYGGAVEDEFSETDSIEIGRLIATGTLREEAFMVVDGFGQMRQYCLKPSEYPFTEKGNDEVNVLLGKDPAATDLNSKDVHGMTEDELVIHIGELQQSRKKKSTGSPSYQRDTDALEDAGNELNNLRSKKANRSILRWKIISLVLVILNIVIPILVTIVLQSSNG